MRGEGNRKTEIQKARVRGEGMSMGAGVVDGTKDGERARKTTELEERK